MTKQKSSRGMRPKTSGDRSSHVLQDLGLSRQVPGLNQSRGLLHMQLWSWSSFLKRTSGGRPGIVSCTSPKSYGPVVDRVVVMS